LRDDERCAILARRRADRGFTPYFKDLDESFDIPAELRDPPARYAAAAVPTPFSTDGIA
jgi:hypothetical protein